MSADIATSEEEGGVTAVRIVDAETAEMVKRACRGIAKGRTLSQVLNENDADRLVSLMTEGAAIATDLSVFEAVEKAREIRSGLLEDLMLDAAHDTSGDMVLKETKGGATYEAVDMDNINRAKLKVQTYQWLMERWAPHRYGQGVAKSGKALPKRTKARPALQPTFIGGAETADVPSPSGLSDDISVGFRAGVEETSVSD